MSSVLEAMLEAGEISEEGVEDVEIGGSNDSGLECHSRLTRLAALMTRAQLDGIIGFLRSLRDSETPTEVDKNELINLLQPIPPELPGFDEPGAAAASGPLSSSCTDDDKALSNKAKKTGLANRISNAANSLSNAGRNAVVKRSGDNSSNNSASEDPVNNGGSASGGVSSDDASPVGGPNGLTNGQVPLMPRNPDLVLVIPILDGGGGVMPGFLSEEHVLNRSRQASRVVRMNLANLPGRLHETFLNMFRPFMFFFLSFSRRWRRWR